MGFYDTAAWKKARQQALHDFDWLCTHCRKSLIGLGRGAHVHHRKELKRAPALALEPQNLRPVCRSCHNRLEPRDLPKRVWSSKARPNLPKPQCRVILVCGPVGAGKSTYVEKHKGEGDTIIDFDTIAKEMGYPGRARRPVGKVLDERNRRLEALSAAPSPHTTWVILTAASPSLRAWWCQQLGVVDDDLVVLVPDKEELHRRILADPSRSQVQAQHFALVDQWYEREARNDPGYVTSACDEQGNPTDPLHPWNMGTR